MIKKNSVIGDVLKKYPGVAGIMLGHGLHCVGCHANAYDTIENGARVHGLDDETISSMVIEINRFISELKKTPEKVFVSEVAAGKIKELKDKEKIESHGLRVSVMSSCSGFVYQMNFEKKPGKNDVVLEDKKVKLFIDKDSLDMLRGSEIDYVETVDDSCFKINNPNAKQSCGCGKSCK